MDETFINYLSERFRYFSAISIDFNLQNSEQKWAKYELQYISHFMFKQGYKWNVDQQRFTAIPKVYEQGGIV